MNMHYAVQFVYLSPKTKFQKKENYLEKKTSNGCILFTPLDTNLRKQWTKTIYRLIDFEWQEFTSTSSHFESGFTTNINDIKI